MTRKKKKERRICINPPIRGSIDYLYTDDRSPLKLYQSPYKGFNRSFLGSSRRTNVCINPPIRGSIGGNLIAKMKLKNVSINPPIRGSIAPYFCFIIRYNLSQSPYKGFNRVTADGVSCLNVGSQSPYKGFNSVQHSAFGCALRRIRSQSPYKGFNRTR